MKDGMNLKLFCNLKTGVHVMLKLDNSYINEKSGTMLKNATIQKNKSGPGHKKRNLLFCCTCNRS